MDFAPPTAGTPGFSPLPGTFSSAQTVSFSSSTAGATFIYTTNGSAPSTTSGTCTPSSGTAGASVVVSANETVQVIACASGYTNSALATGVYTITSGVGGGVVVNLSSYYNVYGIATVGTAPKNGGFDGGGNSYNSSLLGTSIGYQGLTFTLAAANALDALYNQTVSLPAGQYGQIVLLGAGVYGAQANQSIVVNYTDGSSSTFTQSFSDWGASNKYTGESVVSSTTTRITPNGTASTNGPWYVYGYTFTLNSAKTVSSVKLPNNRDVVFFGIGLAAPAASSGPVVNLSSYYNVYGISTVGTAPKNGGLDSESYNYSSSTLGTSVSFQGLNFTFGPANAADAVNSQTITLPSGQYNQLYLVGTGVNGSQTNQTVVVNYTDGSSSTFTQSFSSWTGSNGYTGETQLLKLGSRIQPSGNSTSGTYYLYGYTFSLTSGKTASSVKLPNNRNVIILGAGLGNASLGTAITPYIQVNGGSWQQTNTANVNSPFNSVNLGPQPVSGGSWSWSGPFGYTSTSRQINNIPLYVGTDTYVATYTNTSGIKSTETFTITVGFFGNITGSTTVQKVK